MISTNKYSLAKCLLLFVVLSIYSCVQNPNSRTKLTSKSTSAAETKASETSPGFSSGENFFQNGSTQSTSNFLINQDFLGSIYLRGKEVHSFILNGNIENTTCLIGYFPDSTGSKIMALALSPQYFYDFTKNSKEYYYLIRPNDEVLNKNFCQKTGIINQVEGLFPMTTTAYSLSSTCPNCLISFLPSSEILLFDQGGYKIKPINSIILKMIINMAPGASNQAGVVTCSSTSDCQARGFDCCSLGLCVKDGQLKSGVDVTSLDYLQALSDIQLDPLKKRDYPNFYYICGTNNIPVITIPPTEPIDEELQAYLRFQELEDLYKCVNPIKGEMSICTLAFPNVAKNPGPYYTLADDRNFNFNYSGNQVISGHSITEVTHGGEIIFKEGQIPANGVTIGPSNNLQGNDNFFDTLEVGVTHVKSASAVDDTVKVKYKIDGTCEELNTSLARCKKYYLQGQNTGDVDDHYPASNFFQLPFYADLQRSITVKQNGVDRSENLHWRLNVTSPATVEFLDEQTFENPDIIPNLQVFDGETIEITFYVDNNQFQVFQSKKTALTRINVLCNCGGLDCNLKPVYAANDFQKTTPVDYECLYPNNAAEPPLQQVIMLSSKSTPVRYFDVSGSEHLKLEITTPKQEGGEFKYLDNQGLLKPNNVDQYVGFNEIYGSLGYSTTSAKPPGLVNIKSGKTYDIFVDTGSFSSCFYCGNDYYSALVKLFPKNFLYLGGGILPDPVSTNPSTSKEHRAHDMLFGRACWLPATMIPYTHNRSSDGQSQRLNRLASQHFLFSNGYQRDWFGFDYGSVIGSFDGVTWFSVGNQRRIKANSNRLYLAINAYFGDLTQESTYRIVVSDASSIPFSGSSVTEDLFNDGAQCRLYHQCTTDKDCVTQLGWDYACENVSGIKSIYPNFDVNGFEITNSESVVRLFSKFQASTGSNKRCVYRGQGAPCTPNTKIANVDLTFNKSTLPRNHACSFNNYCQKFSEGVLVSKFNNKIARWGKSVSNQNISDSVLENDLDTFGLGSRIIGRPFNYNGNEDINSLAKPNLSHNLVNAICLPGRDLTKKANISSVSSSNGDKPTDSSFKGDKTNGIGMTSLEPLSGSRPQDYFSSCGIFDTKDNFFHYNVLNLDKKLDDTGNLLSQIPGLTHLAASQAISTNAIPILEALSNKSIIKNFDTSQVTKLAFEKNRCLRAPGSACFTDVDCAANSNLSQIALGINAEDTANTSILNEFEINFWQEELICGQAEKKDKTNAKYNLNKNKCCRDRGLDLTIASLVKDSNELFNNTQMPGLTVAYNDKKRYHRMAPAYSKMVSEPLEFPALSVPQVDACSLGVCMSRDSVKKEWKTLQEVGINTCCTGHFIRKFNLKNGGSDVIFNPVKLQTIDKSNFKCLNWAQCSGTSCGDFSCAHTAKPDDGDCLIRNISNRDALPVFKFLETLELTGIGQVSVDDETSDGVKCEVGPTDQSVDGAAFPIPKTIVSGQTKEYDSSGTKYYSASDTSNFQSSIKTIWEQNKYRCCLPAGTIVSDDTDAKECCSGLIADKTCKLPDYADISVYFNKYISSEGKDIPENLFDDHSGYLNNLTSLQLFACQKRVCASNLVAFGVALSNLKVPGHAKKSTNVKRFVDGDTDDNKAGSINKFYDAGLRWNTHLYCVPTGTASDTTTGLTVVNCATIPSAPAETN